MNKRRVFGDEVINELVKVIFIIVMYAIFKIKFSESSGFINKLEDSFIIIGTSITYFVFYSAFSIFKRPIKIDLNLINFFTKENSTTLCRTGVTRQDMSTITINLNIKESDSAWNRAALWLLKKHTMSISIFTEPENSSVICLPIAPAENIKIKNNGFSVELNTLLKSNLTKAIPFEREYSFIVTENRDCMVAGDDKFFIAPHIEINNEPIGYIMKKFIDFKITSEKNYHSVIFRV